MITLPPFKAFLASNIPSVYDNTLSYYDELTKLIAYLEQQVVPAVNANTEGLKVLKDYVENYFKNLDVQEEIDNKLDEMAASGQLETIIAAYLQMGSILAYDTLSDLKNAENFIDGSICMRIGLNSYDDGKFAYYKIREKQEGDIIDEDNIISLSASASLVGEKLNDIRFSNIETELTNITTPASDTIDAKVGYSYSLMTYYTLVSIPRSKYDFDLVHYSQYTDGVYKYVNNNPDHLYANGQLSSPTIIDGQVYINDVPNDAEYWYILGCEEDGTMKYTKDLTRQFNGTALLSDGYYEAFGVWCPITLNGGAFNPATELNTSDPNYDYIINGKHTRTIFGYDNNNFYIVAIEGRTSRSEGCDFNGTLALMNELNIPNSFNMDGGGSSQVWISNPTYNLVFSDNSTSTKGYSSRRVFSLIKFNKKG